MTHFEAAVREDFEASRGHPQFEVWLDYALSANTRGTALLDALGPSLPELRGARHLDIGCGYGGACVAAARRGADSTGIDIDERLLRFAAANRADHPSFALRFVHGNLLDPAQLESLGTFDFVTCDNVIEHVVAPPVLVAHFRRLLRPGGKLFVTIPNAFSTAQIRKDCHYGQFGVSLLDPIDGATFMEEVLGNRSYDVSDYHPFELYEAMFKRHGLVATLLHAPDGSGFDAAVADARRLSGELEAATVPASLRPKVARRLSVHLAQLEADVHRAQALGPIEGAALRAELVRDHACELWMVLAIREEDAGLPPRRAAPQLMDGPERLVQVARRLGRAVKRRLPGLPKG